MSNVTVNDLHNVIGLQGLPDELLQWIIDHSDYVEFEDGQTMMASGEPTDHMMIIIEGAAAFYMDINGRQVYYFNFENDNSTGGIGGVLPYSRMTKSPGYAYAIGKVRSLRLHRDHFPELERLSPEFIKRCIANMTDRARVFATTQLQHEKVSALGKLSAGIAHELNNPASAINRISHELDKRLIINFDLTERLLFHCISNELIKHLRSLADNRSLAASLKNRLSAMEKMKKEDEIAAWLERNKVRGVTELCETFVESNIYLKELEEIKNAVSESAFADVLRWFENLLTSRRIINDLEQASGRISKLVGAIKSHVHMDRTNDKQPTNVREDIENTLTLLGHKLREKNITVTKQFSDELPEIEVFVGELNQVWMNIIDNAIYAMGKDGNLKIELFTRNDDLKINIIDNGSGIPAEVIPKIFDPFFTTKKVGQGTGIGLDLVARIIKRHNGEIKVNSVPGRTEFSLCLPIHQKKEVEHA